MLILLRFWLGWFWLWMSIRVNSCYGSQAVMHGDLSVCGAGRLGLGVGV